MPILTDRILRDFGPPVEVSTLTVLMDWTSFGEDPLDIVSLYCVNMDDTNECTFILETSEDKLAVDADKSSQKIAPGKADGGTQVSFDVSNLTKLSTYWRLSAQTDSPTFNVVQVKFRIKAQVRTK